MRVTLVGTPAFSLPTFDALYRLDDFEIVQVITKTGRPAGRGLKLASPEVFAWARAKGLDVLQLEKMGRRRDAGTALLDLSADALVVVASAFYIPSWLREAPRLGAVNLHPSLLPELRGAAPINWAIINGLAVTGVTTMRMGDEIDAGDILLQETVAVEPRETAGALAAKLAAAGARLMVETLRGLDGGDITPTPQDHSRATAAPKINAALRAIDWRRDARELDRLVRGLYPTPAATAAVAGGAVQVLEAFAVESAAGAPGLTVAVDERGVTVACGRGALRLTRVKPAGRKEMSAHAFALGKRVRVGTPWESGTQPRDES
jgi:methionyl-tRNA formyltransferase